MAADIDLELVRRTLEAQRDDTRERVAQLTARPERGAAQGFGKRIGDGTVEAISRLTDIGVGSSLESTLARTERALAKIDEGTYGICDACGQPIGAARLRALPDGVFCLGCAAAERRAPARR
jgi:DnaK suppressor protein